MDMAQLLHVLHDLHRNDGYGLPIWSHRGDPRTALFLTVYEIP